MKPILLFLFSLLSACALYHEEDDVPLPREEFLKIVGLQTSPDEYGLLPPGTMHTAQNVLMRRPGVIEALPLHTTWSTPGFTGNIVKQWAGYGENVLAVQTSSATSSAANVVSMYNPSGLLHSYIGSTFTYGTKSHSTAFAVGKTQRAIIHNHPNEFYVLTGDTLTYVIDSFNAGARLAGLPAPGAIKLTHMDTGYGPVLLAGNSVKYKALFFRSNPPYWGLRGADTQGITVTNVSGSNMAATLVVYWSKATSPLKAGDFVEIYRSNQDADVNAVDDEYALAKTYVLTSTDISNGFTAAIQDTTQDSGLGQSLYTNATQDGESMANYMPPTSTDVVNFRGATLYVAASTWSSLHLSMGSFLVTGESDQLKTTGIGRRTMNLTGITSGSAVTTAAGATDVVGVVAGQELVGANAATFFPAHTRILSVVGLTVTMNKNALSTPGVSVPIIGADVLTVTGANAGDILMTNYNEAVTQAASLNTGVNIVPDFPYADVVLGDTTPTGASFTLIDPIPAGLNFTVTGTNPSNYSPPLTSVNPANDVRTNRIYYSRPQLGESVPALNYFDVGSGDVLRIVATESSVYAFCTDGIYRITGDGVNWRVDPFDPTTILLHRDAVDVMDNVIYAWTTEGLSVIGGGGSSISSTGTITSSSGVNTISQPVQQDVRALWRTYATALHLGGDITWGTSVVCDNFNNEVWFTFVDLGLSGSSSESFNAIYIYNTETKQLTTAQPASITLHTPYSLAYVPFIGKLVLGRTLLYAPSATPGNVESATVVFNPLWASRLGNLKQWMAVNYNWGTITAPSFSMTPLFDATTDPARTVSNTETTIVPVPRHSALAKRLSFGFNSAAGGGSGYFQLTGVSVRFRGASETLQR